MLDAFFHVNVEKIDEKIFCVHFWFLVQLANLMWKKTEYWTNDFSSKHEIIDTLGGIKWNNFSAVLNLHGSN